MVKAAIFDLDGLLINSEPLWEEAQMFVYTLIGVELDPSIFNNVKGFRLEEAVGYVYQHHPWEELSTQYVANMIVNEVERLVLKKGEALPGIENVFSILRKNGVRVALASSSFHRIIKAALKRLNMENEFELISSGQDCIYGKPNPEIYIKTCISLDLEPWECLVFEDSLNGVIAGKAAKMKVVAVPEKRLGIDLRFSIADYVLETLEDFEVSMLQ